MEQSLTNIPLPPKLTHILRELEQRKLDNLQGWMTCLPEGNYNVSADFTTLIRQEAKPNA